MSKYSSNVSIIQNADCLIKDDSRARIKAISGNYRKLPSSIVSFVFEIFYHIDFISFVMINMVSDSEHFVLYDININNDEIQF